MKLLLLCGRRGLRLTKGKGGKNLDRKGAGRGEIAVSFREREKGLKRNSEGAPPKTAELFRGRGGVWAGV